MRTNIPVLPIGVAAPARALASIAALLMRVAKAFARARRHRREALALSGLERGMLKDIGITRADLNDAFSTPFWEDPTAVLHERAIERRLGRRAVAAPVPHGAGPQAPYTRPRLDRPSRQAI